MRKEIAEFIAHFQRMTYAPKHAHTDQEVKGEVVSTMDKFYLSYLKINLLINPQEDDHKELVSALQRMHRGMTEEEFDAMQAQSELIEISQRILKREWERVKKAA